MIEKIKNCIAAFPGFAGFVFTAEALAPQPGSAALVCKGREILSRRQDILGAQTCRVRMHFVLMLHGAKDPLADDPALAQALLEFSRWLPGNAPTLGANQTVSAEKGRLAAASGAGIARYETQVVFEFDE